MIFLTTGTQLPFDRLLRGVDDWIEARQPDCEIFAQALPSEQNPYRPRNFETTARLSPAEYAGVFDKAHLIISHAGMGTILTALTERKKICVMPRQTKYNEHRNDHQLATVKQLGEHPGLFTAHDAHDLPGCLDKALQAEISSRDAAIDLFAAASFTDNLRTYILSGKTPG